MTPKDEFDCKSRKENPQKLTQLRSRSHPRHPVGKRTAQKDTIIDITSDSQVNSNFPNRWSPASLTLSMLYDVTVTNHNTSLVTMHAQIHVSANFGDSKKKDRKHHYWFIHLFACLKVNIPACYS